MIGGIVEGVSGLIAGFQFLFTEGVPNVVMLCVGGFLLYLAVAKNIEPLLLLPIGFGCVLVNIPLSEVMDQGGILRSFYDMGIMNELFPLLIFVGVGAMMDFTPLLAQPTMVLLGAATRNLNSLPSNLSILPGRPMARSQIIGASQIHRCDLICSISASMHSASTRPEVQTA